jgi:hypothetical protein
MSDQILPPARHETRDIAFRPLLIGAVLMALALAGIAGAALWMFPHTLTDVVVPNGIPAYPQPTLQTSPSQDMARFYRAEMAELNGTGWVDRDKGIVHVPIAQAMQEVVRRGIPDWPTKSAGAKP